MFPEGRLLDLKLLNVNSLKNVKREKLYHYGTLHLNRKSNKLTTHKSTHTGSLPPLSESLSRSIGREGGGSSSKPLLRRGWGRPYTHLFFDLDNTLWDFSANSREALKQTLEKLGLISRLDSFDAYFKYYEQINESLWAEYRAKKINKQTLIAERFSRSLEAFEIKEQDWEGINRLYLESMALQTRLFPGTRETLAYLKKKGYQMHIITNGFSEVQHAKLNNCGLTDFFGKVFISEEIKTTKPHREIFEHALKSTNAKKQKSIMIGDSWETDIEGAMAFGMDQVMNLNNGDNKIPETIKTSLSTVDSMFLISNQHTKTYFINEIRGLASIL